MELTPVPVKVMSATCVMPELFASMKASSKLKDPVVLGVNVVLSVQVRATNWIVVSQAEELEMIGVIVKSA